MFNACRANSQDEIGSEEKLYTYTVITTDSNQQLRFLHDRMPVILGNGSKELRTWLDPGRSEWSAELQSLLKPYEGELDVYPVSKEVGKVGNNSPSFIVPLSSSENKQNIANFFGHAKGTAISSQSDQKHAAVKSEKSEVPSAHLQIEHEPNEDRKTVENEEGAEDNAPLPVPNRPEGAKPGRKRPRDEDGDTTNNHNNNSSDNKDDLSEEQPVAKAVKHEADPSSPLASTAAVRMPPSTGRKTRQATSNAPARTQQKSPAKTGGGRGNQKITNFLGR